MTALLDAALAYAAQGWPVLPLHNPDKGACSCGRSDCDSPAKHPRLEHGLKEATTDADTLRTWWRRWPAANIGLRTGTVADVLDLDSADVVEAFRGRFKESALDPLSLPRVGTGKGTHVYFAPTGAGNRTGVIPGVDWRGRDGYVLAPPSRHISGTEYAWRHPLNGTPPTAPAWLVDLVVERPRPVPAARVATSISPYAQRALEAEVTTVVQAAEGTRNDSLNRAAFSLYQLVAGGELGDAEVSSALERAAVAAGLSAAEAERTIASGRQGGLQAPRTAPLAPVQATPRSVQAAAAEIHSDSTTGVATERNSLPWRTAAEIATATPEQVAWVSEPWVAAGAITELAGPPKAAGKTTFAFRMAAAVLDGADFLGRPTRRGAVVLLTEEADATLRPALSRAGLLGRADLHVLRRRDVPRLRWPDVCRAAFAKCREVGAVLLIVDTAAKWMQLRGEEENSSGAVMGAMEPIQAESAPGLAVLLIRHERKSGGMVGEAGRGSNAWTGDVDVSLSLRRLEGNATPNGRRLEALSRFDETPSSLVVELTDAGYLAHGNVVAIKRHAAEEVIRAALPGSEPQALTRDEVCELTDVKTTTCGDVLEALTVAGEVIRSGEGKKGSPHRYHRPKIHSVGTPSLERRKETEANRVAVPPTADEEAAVY